MNGALDGRAGVITGGGSGIGRALADAFAAAGARVAVLDLDGADAAAAELGGGAIALTADVTAEALDFLVNSAGIRHVARFTELPVDVWRRTIDVNLTGTFLCCQAAARLMLERGGGAIVNLASIAGQLALTQRAAYNASKGGVMALTRSIAADLAADGIRCNAIAPGVIETPLSAPYFTDERMRTVLETNAPNGRWGQVADVAGPAVFLCSDAAAHVHGETLFVDGGWNAAKGY